MNTTKTRFGATSMTGKKGSLRTRARRFRLLVALAAVAVLLAVGATALQSPKQAEAATANIIIVSPFNLQGWQAQHAHCNGGTSTGSQQFVSGPATPPLGAGSYRLIIGSDGDSFETIGNSGFEGVRLDQLTALSYSTYITHFTDGQAPYLALGIDFDGDAKADDELFFEPQYQSAVNFPPNPQGPPVEGQWQTWDALNGGWWSANNICGAGPGMDVKSIAQYLVCQPNARLLDPGTGEGGFRIAAGCGGKLWANFDGNIDNVTIGFSAPPGSPKGKPVGAGSETTFDFEPNACVLTCPPNVIQDNDPGECGAIVQYSAPETSGDCGEVTCTPASGSFFPVGVTTVTCTNQTVILGERSKTPSGGSCIPNTLTESTSQTITPQNSFVCATGFEHADNHYWRAFTLSAFSISNNFQVQSVDIGIESATSGGAAPGKVSSKGAAFSRNSQKGAAPNGGPGQLVILRLYTNTGGPFPGGALNLIASASNTIPDQALTIVTLPISALVPPDSELVVEVFTPNGSGRGNLFIIGSNAEPETAPSYVSAADCKIFDPTPTADIGFPDMHIVMNVNGCEQIVTCSFNVTVRDTEPPTITCPANVTQNTDPDQCSAVVVYPDPAVSDNCPTNAPVCAPASGSTFPKGVTTVTCSVSDSSGSTASCSFTVTVNDAQPPQITCPGKVTAVTDQNACPSPQCATVTYPNPVATDNCPGVVAVCNPPSGSCFPVGVTTVTCTATDSSGNTATCTFTVTTFDTALQDDANPSTILVWNSITGSYRFCCNGITFTGVGKATRQGCVYTLDQTNAVDRRVLGRVDKGVHAGSASIQAPAGTIRCTIGDRNTLNDTNLSSCQ